MDEQSNTIKKTEVLNLEIVHLNVDIATKYVCMYMNMYV